MTLYDETPIFDLTAFGAVIADEETASVSGQDRLTDFDDILLEQWEEMIFGVEPKK